MSHLFCLSQNRSNTTPKSNGLLLGVFSLILGLIILTVNTVIVVQKPMNEFELCSGNLLDKREFHYAKNAGGSYDNSRMIYKFGSCQLLHYNFENVVGCIDALNERHKSAKNLHFAFIGDSRIRQQFFNFLKLIPDYDRKSQPNPIPPTYHDDIEVSSDILGLHVSFKWRPIITDEDIDTILHWTTDSQSDRPNFLVIGMALWHMWKSEGADHRLYERKLRRLAPFLGQLANVSQVIWLNQYPTVEFYGEINAHNTDIFSEKIHHYNQAIRRILGDYKSIRIWDSSNPLVEEYVRGCSLSRRVQLRKKIIVDAAYAYVNCKDATHAGYSALSQSTQLLFNYLCNDHTLYQSMLFE